MKKRLLTLMLSFKFVVFGMLVANVKASDHFIPKIKDTQNQISKSINKDKLINEF